MIDRDDSKTGNICHMDDQTPICMNMEVHIGGPFCDIREGIWEVHSVIRERLLKLINT